MWERAIASAQQAGNRETAAIYLAAEAVCEAHCGNWSAARKRARAALEVAKGRDIEYAAAFALALSGFGGLYTVYVRGQAYLAAGRGQEAAAEFQKVLDHRGIVLADPVGVLAHLQLGRAYVVSGDRIKARSAYQDFLALWKDADPDIPILKQAKAEYAKLQ
jgi:tetratricopeptide (TPR) repeat protein